VEKYNGDNIEELKKEMYEREFKSPIPSPRQRFSEHDVNVEREWKHDTPLDNSGKPIQPKVIAGSFFKKVLTISLIFFTLSAALLLYMFLGGWNIISASNVEINFLGPISTSAGTELDFDIVIDNQNRSNIENAILYIDYPEGTKNVSDITVDLLHDKIEVGEVLSKNTARRTARAILFGELNSSQQIKVILEYGLKNSNATYRKEKIYDIKIASTPLTISVVKPQQIISNGSVELRATVTSNSNVPLTNLLLEIHYPPGFLFGAANPEPTLDKSFWLIEKLDPGEKRDFVVSGTLQGEQNDERVFRYTVGIQDVTNPKNISTRYLTQTESIFIQRPPIGIEMRLNGDDSPTATVNQGQSIQGEITIFNNLPVRVIDAEVKVMFSGPLFDPTNVQGGNGFYQSQTNTIIWDKTNQYLLDSLEPGQEVNFGFSFATLPPSQTVKNGKMALVVHATGKQVSQSDNTKSVISTISRSVQTQTSIGVLQQISYSTGPFRNRGPVPPKVNERTTYTVTWLVTNSSNDVRSAEVRGQLPSYVKWSDVTTPSNESITWNEERNEVVWRVGDLAAGTGITKPSRQVSFQVEIVPSTSQIGDDAMMVGDLSMTAIDSFTNSPLTAKARNVTTRLNADPTNPGAGGKISP
jgi:hypothetical protein